MTREMTSTPTRAPSAVGLWAVGEARRIVCEEIGHLPAKVILFGSWARGTADRQSDIDIGILPEGAVPPALISTLRERLEESDIPFHVDVIDLRLVDAAFRNRVLTEGTPWTV